MVVLERKRKEEAEQKRKAEKERKLKEEAERKRKTEEERKRKEEEERNVQKTLDTTAAALVFNELSPAEGYDAFDADADGHVILSDLQSAVNGLKLDISEQDSKSLFESLDAGKTGFIPRGVWVESIKKAKPEDVLKSRGIVVLARKRKEEVEQKRKVQEERMRKEEAERKREAEEELILHAQGLKIWFESVGLIPEDAMDVAVDCVRQNVSCPLSLCMMPERALCKFLEESLLQGLWQFVPTIIKASRVCKDSRQESPLTPSNVSPTEWMRNVGCGWVCA
jgi:hypothetical protein